MTTYAPVPIEGPAPSAGELFAALADPTRREIFERVAAHPRSVGELAEALPVSRPAVSQHLRVLKTVGLVTDHAVGARRVYRMDTGGIAELHAYLEQFWDQALATFKTIVEQPEETP